MTSKQEIKNHCLSEAWEQKPAPTLNPFSYGLSESRTHKVMDPFAETAKKQKFSNSYEWGGTLRRTTVLGQQQRFLRCQDGLRRFEDSERKIFVSQNLRIVIKGGP